MPAPGVPRHPTPASSSLCGDPTCESYGCSQAAIDAWLERQEVEAKEIFLAAAGLPPMEAMIEPRYPTPALLISSVEAAVPAEGAGLEELARAYVDLKQVADAVSIMWREVETRLGDAMESKHFTLENIGTFEKLPATSRKSWDHPLLAEKIVQKALDNRAVDMDTGEVEDPVQVATKALLSTAGISYWRVGEVKKLGINADEYCEKEYGNPRVKYIP